MLIAVIIHTVFNILMNCNLKAHLLDTAEIPLGYTGVNCANVLKGSLAS